MSTATNLHHNNTKQQPGQQIATKPFPDLSLSLSIYIYIYLYRERERERAIDR